MATPKAGYRTRDGVRVPSVTTILSRYKDSGALMRWTYSQGREHGEKALTRYLWETLKPLRENAGPLNLQQALYQSLGPVLMGNTPPPEAPRDQYDTSGKAADAGTIAHDAIEAHVLGRDPEAVFQTAALMKHPDDVLTRARNSYAQYLRWRDVTRIEIVATEQGLVSEKHRYGGTLDAVGKIGDEIVLLDWKTSNGVYGDYLYQLAAYALLLEENRPEWTPRGFHILRVAKESADFAHHSFGELDREKEAFILMRLLYEIDARTSKRA